jgi:hypothetical protein
MCQKNFSNATYTLGSQTKHMAGYFFKQFFFFLTNVDAIVKSRHPGENRGPMTL